MTTRLPLALLAVSFFAMPVQAADVAGKDWLGE